MLHTAAPASFFIDNAGGSNALATAPVQGIPHGAVVTGLDIWDGDNASEDLTVVLLECPHDSSALFSTDCSQVAVAASSGASSDPVRTSSAPPGLTVPIDLESNAYHILAGTPIWTNSLVLRSVRLRFSN